MRHPRNYKPGCASTVTPVRFGTTDLAASKLRIAVCMSPRLRQKIISSALRCGLMRGMMTFANPIVCFPGQRLRESGYAEHRRFQSCRAGLMPLLAVAGREGVCQFVSPMRLKNAPNGRGGKVWLVIVSAQAHCAALPESCREQIPPPGATAEVLSIH